MDRTEISVADNRKPSLLRDTYSLSQNRQKLSYGETLKDCKRVGRGDANVVCSDAKVVKR
ncbi:Uncharacterized protein DBV15_11454 [Temnothorax longispinosus]|uniref:Uncharacterized protein n=1 Tax=Temnothorax longispinosus TaxID=300112 RepID=A0A4S2KP01_9HYME|nr:Uncharacterized protein DBV15_11454 [Temnothorax longispinosus]